MMMVCAKRIYDVSEGVSLQSSLGEPLLPDVLSQCSNIVVVEFG